MYDNFIYQKKDFVKLGVKEGSFNYLMTKLNLNNQNFCITKVLPNGIKAKFYNKEAYKKIAEYLENNKKNKVEILLIKETDNLKEKIVNLQNQLIIANAKDIQKENDFLKEKEKIKAEYQKRIDKITEEKNEIEKGNKKLIKEKVEADKEKYQQEIKFKSMSIFDFIKWKYKKDQNNLALN